MTRLPSLRRLRQIHGDDCWLAALGECCNPDTPKMDFESNRGPWHATRDHICPQIDIVINAQYNLRLAHSKCNSRRHSDSKSERNKTRPPKANLILGVFYCDGAYEVRIIAQGGFNPRRLPPHPSVKAALESYLASP